MKAKILLIRNKTFWYNPYTWLFPIIRKVSGSRFNHIAISIKEPHHSLSFIYYEEERVYEALSKGFRSYYSYNDWLKRGEKIGRKYETIEVKLDYEQIKRFTEMKNRPYDYFALTIGHLWKLLFGVFPDRGNSRVTCFEAVAYILGWFQDKSGVGHITGKDFEKFLI